MASSRYQVFGSSFSTFSLIDWVIGEKVNASKRGANGSRCWTEVRLVTFLSPKINGCAVSNKRN